MLTCCCNLYYLSKHKLKYSDELKPEFSNCRPENSAHFLSEVLTGAAALLIPRSRLYFCRLRGLSDSTPSRLLNMESYKTQERFETTLILQSQPLRRAIDSLPHPSTFFLIWFRPSGEKTLDSTKQC